MASFWLSESITRISKLFGLSEQDAIRVTQLANAPDQKLKLNGYTFYSKVPRQYHFQLKPFEIEVREETTGETLYSVRDWEQLP